MKILIRCLLCSSDVTASSHMLTEYTVYLYYLQEIRMTKKWHEITTVPLLMFHKLIFIDFPLHRNIVHDFLHPYSPSLPVTIQYATYDVTVQDFSNQGTICFPIRMPKVRYDNFSRYW